MKANPTTNAPTRRINWKLFAIVVGGALLRLPTIGRESLWFDEAISYLTAELPLAQILNNTIHDPHPPFYYLALSGWFKLIPAGDVNGRLLSVLFSVGGILLVYWLTQTLFNKQNLALIAAGLLAISPFQTLYSHELRMYTLLMLLTTATAAAYWQARARQGGWWLWFALLSALTMYTHLFSAFFLLAIGVHALLHWRERETLYKTIAVGAFIALLFLPWIYVLTSESDIAAGSLRPLQSDTETYNPIKPITSVAFLLFGQANSLWYGGMVFFLTLAMAIIFILELFKARKQGENLSSLQLPALAIVLIIGAPNLVYMLNPFFLPERTMAAAAPFLLIFLAWGVTRKQSPLPYLVGLTAVVMSIGLIVYHTNDKLIKPPYRDVIQYVAQQRQASDVILHTSDASYLPSLSYTDLPDHALLDGDPFIRKPQTVYEALGGELWEREEAAAKNGRLWLIVALEHSVEWQEEQAAYFQEQYPLLNAYDFDGIQLYLYDLSNKP